MHAEAYNTGRLLAYGAFIVIGFFLIFLFMFALFGSLGPYPVMMNFCAFTVPIIFVLIALYRRSKFVTEEEFKNYYDGIYDQFDNLKDGFTYIGAWGALLFLIGGLIACGITLYFSEYGYALIAGIVCVISFIGLYSIISSGDKETSNVCTKCGKETARRYGGGTCWDCSPQRVAAIYYGHKRLGQKRV